MLPVAILAGGLATRLRPLTETIPKALVDVAGEPFVFHQLRLLAERGCERVVLCLGHLGGQIVAAVGDGHAFGLRVDYAFDGERPRGTAGAIAGALPKLGADFLILYGDSYLECDYWAVEAAYRRSGMPALMTVLANDGRWDVSNVDYRDGRIIAYSKTAHTPHMRHIDYGLGVANRAVFAGIPEDRPADLATIYEELAGEGRLAAQCVGRRFYEIGSFDGRTQLEAHLRKEVS
jgi:N-acetyl-alpha-D-muramate 1-phosphate uridylyltransferase